MGFSRFTNDVKNISGLPDQLKNQAEYLKNKFDKGDVEQQESFNKLIDELESSTAALYLGAKKLNGEDSNVQTILTSLSAIVKTLDESVKEIRRSIGENGEITDYNLMINMPQINGVELKGNKTLDDLGIQAKGDYATNENLKTLNNKMSEVGNIRLYSSKEEREKALLCDGSSIFASEFPGLKNKLKGYDFFIEQNYTDLGFTALPHLYYLNGYFVLCVGTQLSYSADGQLWQTVNTPVAFAEIDYDNGEYFAISGEGYGDVYYSTNLTSWVKQGRPLSSDVREGRNILYRKGIVVIGSDYGDVKYSTDKGSTWISIGNSTGSNYSCKGLFYTGSKFIAYIYYGGSTSKYYVYHSDDGVIWTQVNSDTVTTSYVGASGFVKDNYIYYVKSNKVMRTLDGITGEEVSDFTDINSANYTYKDKPVFNGDTIYLFPNESTEAEVPVLYSNDFINWNYLNIEGKQSATYYQTDGEKFIITGSSYSAEPVLKAYYLDSSEKKLILPTYMDETNQIYGYINAEE